MNYHKVVEINNQTKYKINLGLLEKISQEFLKSRGRGKYELSIAIVGDAAMRKLNRTYRKIDAPTDVLSFGGEKEFFGEIILDYDQIKRQARRSGRKTEAELVFILAHGLLHLAGYDDRTEGQRQKMIKRGERFISDFYDQPNTFD